MEEKKEIQEKEFQDNSGIRKWDLFKVVPPSTHITPVEERTWYKVVVRTLKICVYILTFLMVLGGAVFSKFGLLVMAARLNGNAVITSCGEPLTGSNLPVPPEERIYWTWLLYLAFALPEGFTLFRSLRFCIFKGQSVPSLLEFVFPWLFETLHTIGMGLFVFSILPSLDSVKAAVLCTTVCFIPALLGVFSGYHSGGWGVYRILHIIAIVIQGTTIFMWVVSPEESEKNIWILPIALILISFGFWHNYVDYDSKFGFVRYLVKLKPELLENGYFTYTFISIWKMILFFAIMLLSVEIQGVQEVGNMFSMLPEAFAFNATGPAYNGMVRNNLQILQNPLFIQVMGSLLCYVFGKYACKICIQHVSFSLPLTMAVPVTAALIATVNPCEIFNNPFFGSLEFVKPTGNYFTDSHAWIWPIWLLSQFWITIHIWFPNSDRLSRTENMFSVPFYSGILVDQSLALNRRRDKKISKTKKIDTDGNTVYINQSERDDIPRIFACATMWHETEDEMLEIMKSILRMDEDQGVRRVAATQFQIVDNYYEYETHVLFDDAFQLSDPDDYNSPQVLNQFVKTFIGVVDTAAAAVHGLTIHIRAPLKFPTPYGGRLEWTLPGKTKMILHLKDKSKIRHKKRWSQCMYMYYLLGHRLMDLPIAEHRKEIRARNTFILALDGDVDFQPIAVERLVDLMKKNPKLGAACGRIHPTGGPGLMLWYQKFEYAIGYVMALTVIIIKHCLLHWLQKATEHMIGCVLCSPGCFSLFRGKALMSDNVMAKYTTVSTEPRHYVQYDQGEDRWLCTLIIQRGYRVDYSAASDAFTHAPEDFNEFYNQRRRWVPSTTANIMDMLTDYRQTVKINPDISSWYIAYQFFLMFGTIMGPGTIFLMLVGALNAVFGVDKWLSLGLNLVPILIFSFICYYGKSKTQLAAAQILSVIYALLMVAVLVGIAVTVAEEGILSPSSIFLVAVAASFLISAIMHPLEISCLLHGFVYFATIPSMYLLLIIFSIFNINNVSWGTREGPKVKSKQELLAEEKEIEEQKVKESKHGLFSFLREGKDDTEGTFEFSFAGLFKLMCCTHDKQDSSKLIATSLEHLTRRMEAVDRKLEILTSIGGKGETLAAPPLSPTVKRISSFRNTNSKRVSTPLMSPVDEDEEMKVLRRIHFQESEDSRDEEMMRDDMVNPYWITDSVLMRRKIDKLPDSEILFWNELIEKYLLPIEANKKKEKDMAEALLRLRNQCVFTFFMLNSIFVLLIFFLELQKKSLNVPWPFGENDLTLEPIGFTFVIFFAIIMIIQFVAMLFHRFGTLSHILASTPLHFGFLTPCNSKTVEGLRKDKSVSKGGLGLVQALMQNKSFEEATDKKASKKMQEEDNSVANLHRRTLQTMNAYESLEDRFDKNWSRLSEMPERDQEKVLSNVVPIERSQRRDTLNVLKSRLSMRQPSAASEASTGSYTTGSDSSSDSDSEEGNHILPPPIPNTPIPTVRVEGLDNEGFLSEEHC